MDPEVTIVNDANRQLLTRVAAGVFDHEIEIRHCDKFLNDPRHHLAVAIDASTVVGMASAVQHFHPDKPPKLWINEVGIAPTHQRRGLGKALVHALLEVGRRLGCAEAWLLTDRANVPALRLYKSCGGDGPRDQAMFTFPLNSNDVGER